MFEIGNSLREARLRQQLDFPELEQATKIRGKYLRALEEEKFDALPAPTYVKGFLRTYADSLGLDGQLYVDEYNSRFVPGEDDLLVRPREYRPRATPPLTRRIETRVVLLALGAIVVVFALVIAAWKFGSGGKQRYSNLNAPNATPPPAQVRQRAHHPVRPIRPAAHVILTAANGDCWLQIFAGSPSGRLLFEGTLDRGKAQTWTRPRLWVNAGAPHSLVVRVNGRLQQLPGNGSPTKFVITPRGVSPAPAAA